MLIANAASQLVNRLSGVPDVVKMTIATLGLTVTVLGALFLMRVWFLMRRLPACPDARLRASEWWVLGPVVAVGITLISFNIVHIFVH